MRTRGFTLRASIRVQGPSSAATSAIELPVPDLLRTPLD